MATVFAFGLLAVAAAAPVAHHPEHHRRPGYLDTSGFVKAHRKDPLPALRWGEHTTVALANQYQYCKSLLVVWRTAAASNWLSSTVVQGG